MIVCTNNEKRLQTIPINDVSDMLCTASFQNIVKKPVTIVFTFFFRLNSGSIRLAATIENYFRYMKQLPMAPSSLQSSTLLFRVIWQVFNTQQIISFGRYFWANYGFFFHSHNWTRSVQRFFFLKKSHLRNDPQ